MATEARRLALIAVAALCSVGGGIFLLTRPVPVKQDAKITAEAKAYVKFLALGDVGMTSAEAFNGAKLVEIKGTIGNQGTRSLKQVEITCVFYDPYHQIVLRNRQAIVRAATGGLKPGETKPFRLAFDDLAESWNQALPQVIIASIDFE